MWWAWQREGKIQRFPILYYNHSLPTGTTHTMHSWMRRAGQEVGLMGCTFTKHLWQVILPKAAEEGERYRNVGWKLSIHSVCSSTTGPTKKAGARTWFGGFLSSLTAAPPLQSWQWTKGWEVGLKGCDIIKCALQLWDLPRSKDKEGQEEGQRRSIKGDLGVLTSHSQGHQDWLKRAEGCAFINCSSVKSGQSMLKRGESAGCGIEMLYLL